jgi:hypothetical protein
MGITDIGVCMLNGIFRFGGPKSIFMTQQTNLFVDSIVIS